PVPLRPSPFTHHHRIALCRTVGGGVRSDERPGLGQYNGSRGGPRWWPDAVENSSRGASMETTKEQIETGIAQHGQDGRAHGRAQRDAQGRFVKGNEGGPGNPFARRVAELRKAAMAAVTPEDMGAIMAIMAQKAKEGDVAAA